MDYSNFTDGTIFDNIMKINDRMTEKLKMRIDIRTDQILVADDESGEKIDAIKQQEEKLDGYILKFINLNADNKYVIKGALDNLEKRLEDFHKKMKVQMDQNLEEMNSLATME